MRTVLKPALLAATLALSANAGASILPQFQGHWSGECTLRHLDGRTSAFSLQLEIVPQSAQSVSWVMRYAGDFGTMVKNYVLRTENAATGHYVMDENNGILIDMYQYGDRLTANFEVVNETRLATSVEAQGDTLYFENVSFEAKRPRRSNAYNISVLSYESRSIESCVLKR